VENVGINGPQRLKDMVREQTYETLKIRGMLGGGGAKKKEEIYLL